MDIEYSTTGKFIEETSALVEELEADAVMIFVFGSRTKGSGCCCDMRVHDPRRMGRAMIQTLRDMADAMEQDLKAKKGMYDGYHNEHE